MNILEQLATHAHDLSETVGGKHTVEVWSWVELPPGKPLEVHCKCGIGPTGEALADGYAATIEAAFVKCVEEWKKKGAPVDPAVAKLAMLRIEAEKLGFAVVPIEATVTNNEPQPATV